MLAGCQRIIVTFDVTRQGASRSTLQRHTRDSRALLTEFGLRPLVVGDVEAGGVTDAQHLFGFGSNIGSQCLPVVEVGLHRTLHHVLDGGVEGCFPTVLKSSIPQLERPTRAVLWHNGMLRPEGLFPCRSLANTIIVYCPSHRLRDRWAVRELTLKETLRLFQMPLGMDPLLVGLNLGHRLPFADQPSPDLFTLFFRQLWGDDGGGLGVEGEEEKVVRGEDEEDEGERNEEEKWDEGGGGAAVPTERAGWDGMVIHDPSTPKTSAKDAPPDEGEEVGAGELLRVREQQMMASKPDMSPHHERNWTFEFDMDSGEETPARLTDTDTVTLAALEDTWQPRNLGCPHGLEVHEVGPGPRSNPGPPFAVGDVIMCNGLATN